MTDYKPPIARIIVETLIAEAQTARVAAHIRVVLAKLKSRKKFRRRALDGTGHPAFLAYGQPKTCVTRTPFSSRCADFFVRPRRL